MKSRDLISEINTQIHQLRKQGLEPRAVYLGRDTIKAYRHELAKAPRPSGLVELNLDRRIYGLPYMVVLRPVEHVYVAGELELKK